MILSLEMMSKKIPFLVWEVVKILCDAYPETLENCENSGRNHVIDHCMWPRRDIISLEIVKILMLYLVDIIVVSRIRLHHIMMELDF